MLPGPTLFLVTETSGMHADGGAAPELPRPSGRSLAIHSASPVQDGAMHLEGPDTNTGPKPDTAKRSLTEVSSELVLLIEELARSSWHEGGGRLTKKRAEVAA